ncbi:MAG: phosphatidylglycerophosphatase A [Gammaproteobacteria bacterium]|jgi:phosphatidylglycerophosphatase A
MSLQMRNPVHLLAVGFGSGLSAKAPGTFGTVVGVLVYLPLSALSPGAYVATCIVLFIAGVWICGQAAGALNSHDHPSIVYDEIVGYLVTMIAVPAQWPWVLAGFTLFRFFDIIKPWPISVLDRRIKGGFGIMIDDLAAAVLALCLLHLAHWWLA